MPRPSINLTSANLLQNLTEKSGIFKKEDTKNFLTIHLAGDLTDVPPPVSLSALMENYTETIVKGIFKENLNDGLYIRIEELLDHLKEFKKEGLSHLQVTFGLRKAHLNPDGTEIDWNCIHLIMRGARPSPEFETPLEPDNILVGKPPVQVSKTQYSTYDGDEVNYMGPKLGTPPFGK